MSIRTQLDHAPRPGVRTFTPRWRTSPLTAERVSNLLPPVEITAGAWDQARVFGRRAPLALEIGSGHGAAAVAYAVAHPGVDLIAAEVHIPGVVRMLAAAQDRGVDTLRVWRGDAIVLLRELLPAHSLQSIHLFFPDPWPKKKHAKRRFVQQHTLSLLHQVLSDDGVLRIATDHAIYADHVREQVAAHARWHLAEGDRPWWRPTDGFEGKGLAAGASIVDFTLMPR